MASRQIPDIISAIEKVLGSGYHHLLLELVAAMDELIESEKKIATLEKQRDQMKAMHKTELEECKAMQERHREDFKSQNAQLESRLKEFEAKEREEAQKDRPGQQNYLLYILPHSIAEGISFNDAADLAGLEPNAAAVHLARLRRDKLAEMESNSRLWKRTENGDLLIHSLEVSGERFRIPLNEEAMLVAIEDINYFPGLSLEEIAQRAGISVPKAEVVLNRLSKRGFVSWGEMYQDESGFRISEWFVNPNGEGYFKRVRRPADEQDDTE